MTKKVLIYISIDVLYLLLESIRNSVTATSIKSEKLFCFFFFCYARAVPVVDVFVCVCVSECYFFPTRSYHSVLAGSSLAISFLCHLCFMLLSFSFLISFLSFGNAVLPPQDGFIELK